MKTIHTFHNKEKALDTKNTVTNYSVDKKSVKVIPSISIQNELWHNMKTTGFWFPKTKTSQVLDVQIRHSG